MSQGNSCSCSGGPKLIFACSGAADVGLLPTRRLTKEGVGKMFCAAGISGRISGIMKTTESADKILVIDGCPLNCVKNGLEQAGFSKFQHLQLADVGMVRCSSPVTEENICKVAAKGNEMMAG